MVWHKCDEFQFHEYRKYYSVVNGSIIKMTNISSNFKFFDAIRKTLHVFMTIILVLSTWELFERLFKEDTELVDNVSKHGLELCFFGYSLKIYRNSFQILST